MKTPMLFIGLRMMIYMTEVRILILKVVLIGVISLGEMMKILERSRSQMR